MSQVALLMFHTCLLQQLQFLVDSSFVLLVQTLRVFPIILGGETFPRLQIKQVIKFWK